MRQTETFSIQSQDKQLHSVALDSVLEKRRLDQALNAKEFAVLVGISYSTARNWFRLPGFPSFCGVVFWQDFVAWSTQQSGLKAKTGTSASSATSVNMHQLPARASRILLEA